MRQKENRTNHQSEYEDKQSRRASINSIQKFKVNNLLATYT